MRRVTVGAPSVLDLRLLEPGTTGAEATITPDGGVASAPVEAGQVVDDRRWQVTFQGDEVAAVGDATVTWTLTPGGATRTQRVTVVGAQHVDLATAVADSPSAQLADVAEQIDDVADQVTRYTGRRWVPTLLQVDATTDGMLLRLPSPVRQIVSAVDRAGTTVDVASWDVRTPIGVAFTTFPFSGTVTVEAGYDQPPTDLADAMRRAVRHQVKHGATRDLRARANLGEGGQGFPFASASPKHGRLFGIDGVDSVIELHKLGAVA